MLLGIGHLFKRWLEYTKSKNLENKTQGREEKCKTALSTADLLNIVLSNLCWSKPRSILPEFSVFVYKVTCILSSWHKLWYVRSYAALANKSETFPSSSFWICGVVNMTYDMTQLFVSWTAVSGIYLSGVDIHRKSELECSDTKVIFTSISVNKANLSSVGHTSPALSASENKNWIVQVKLEHHGLDLNRNEKSMFVQEMSM